MLQGESLSGNSSEYESADSTKHSSTDSLKESADKSGSPTLLGSALKAVKNLFSPVKAGKPMRCSTPTGSSKECPTSADTTQIRCSTPTGSSKECLPSVDTTPSPVKDPQEPTPDDSLNLSALGMKLKLLSLENTPHNTTNDSYTTTVSRLDDSFQSTVTHLDENLKQGMENEETYCADTSESSHVQDYTANETIILSQPEEMILAQVDLTQLIPTLNDSAIGLEGDGAANTSLASCAQVLNDSVVVTGSSRTLAVGLSRDSGFSPNRTYDFLSPVRTHTELNNSLEPPEPTSPNIKQELNISTNGDTDPISSLSFTQQEEHPQAQYLSQATNEDRMSSETKPEITLSAEDSVSNETSSASEIGLVRNTVIDRPIAPVQDSVSEILTVRGTESEIMTVHEIMTTQDTMPEIMTTHDTIPEIMTTQDTMPEIMTTQDTMPEIMTTQDTMPEIMTTQDTVPEIVTIKKAEFEIQTVQNTKQEIMTVEESGSEVRRAQNTELEIIQDVLLQTIQTENMIPEIMIIGESVTDMMSIQEVESEIIPVESEVLEIMTFDDSVSEVMSLDNAMPEIMPVQVVASKMMPAEDGNSSSIQIIECLDSSEVQISPSVVVVENPLTAQHEASVVLLDTTHIAEMNSSQAEQLELVSEREETIKSQAAHDQAKSPQARSQIAEAEYADEETKQELQSTDLLTAEEKPEVLLKLLTPRVTNAAIESVKDSVVAEPIGQNNIKLSESKQNMAAGMLSSLGSSIEEADRHQTDLLTEPSVACINIQQSSLENQASGSSRKASLDLSGLISLVEEITLDNADQTILLSEPSDQTSSALDSQLGLLVSMDPQLTVTNSPVEESQPTVVYSPVEESQPTVFYTPVEESPVVNSLVHESTVISSPVQEPQPTVVNSPVQESQPTVVYSPVEESQPTVVYSPVEESQPTVFYTPVEESPVVNSLVHESTVISSPVQEPQPTVVNSPVQESQPTVVHSPVEESPVVNSLVHNSTVISSPVQEPQPTLTVNSPVQESPVVNSPIAVTKTQSLVVNSPIQKTITDSIILNSPDLEPGQESSVISSPVIEPISESHVVNSPIQNTKLEPKVIGLENKESSVGSDSIQGSCQNSPVINSPIQEVMLESTILNSTIGETDQRLLVISSPVVDANSKSSVVFVPIKEIELKSPIGDTKPESAVVHSPVKETKPELLIETPICNSPVEETKIESPFIKTQQKSQVTNSPVQERISELLIVNSSVNKTILESPVQETKPPVVNSPVHETIPESPVANSPVNVTKLESPILESKSPVANSPVKETKLGSPIEESKSPVANCSVKETELEASIGEPKSPVANSPVKETKLESPIEESKSPVANCSVKETELEASTGEPKSPVANSPVKETKLETPVQETNSKPPVSQLLATDSEPLLVHSFNSVIVESPFGAIKDDIAEFETPIMQTTGPAILTSDMDMKRSQGGDSSLLVNDLVPAMGEALESSMVVAQARADDVMSNETSPDTHTPDSTMFISNEVGSAVKLKQVQKLLQVESPLNTFPIGSPLGTSSPNFLNASKLQVEDDLSPRPADATFKLPSEPQLNQTFDKATEAVVNSTADTNLSPILSKALVMDNTYNVGDTTVTPNNTFVVEDRTLFCDNALLLDSIPEADKNDTDLFENKMDGTVMERRFDNNRVLTEKQQHVSNMNAANKEPSPARCRSVDKENCIQLSLGGKVKKSQITSKKELETAITPKKEPEVMFTSKKDGVGACGDQTIFLGEKEDFLEMDLASLIQEQFSPSDIETICNAVPAPDLDTLNKRIMRASQEFDKSVHNSTDQDFVFAVPECTKVPELSAHCLDFLTSITGAAPGRDLSRDSLYVKFDPLVSAPTESVCLIELDKEAQPEVKQPVNVVPPLSPRVDKLSSPQPSKANKELVEEINRLKGIYELREKLNQERYESYEQQIAKLMGKSCVLEEKLKESGEREKSLARKAQDQERSVDQLQVIMLEYEKTISKLTLGLENVQRKNKADIAAIKNDRDCYRSHLQNVESAFTDVHSKYERSKKLIENLKNNELEMKKNQQTLVDSLDDYRRKMAAVQERATREMDKTCQKMKDLTQEHEQETARVRALLRKTELQLQTVQSALDRKVNENVQLSVICDDLISGRK